MKTKKKRKLKLWVIIVLLLILLGISFTIYKFFFSKSSLENPATPNVATITNQIEGYNYTLEDRDSELFSEIFKELKENLESETVNQQTYIENMTKLFIIDLFTIDNKMSKYDIGGLEYLYEPAKESFRSKILDTIYKNVEDNSYETRNQILPIVQSVEINSVEKTTYSISETKYEAYDIEASWKYTEDLGYDEKAKIILIQEEEKLSIVSYEPIK